MRSPSRGRGRPELRKAIKSKSKSKARSRSRSTTPPFRFARRVGHAIKEIYIQNLFQGEEGVDVGGDGDLLGAEFFGGGGGGFGFHSHHAVGSHGAHWVDGFKGVDR